MSRHISANGIRWIVNYREALYKGIKVEKLIKLDKHTTRSWDWTKQQSHFIDLYGWDEWFTDGTRTDYKEFGVSVNNLLIKFINKQ